jgi:hypothetical protein
LFFLCGFSARVANAPLGWWSSSVHEVLNSSSARLFAGAFAKAPWRGQR